VKLPATRRGFPEFNLFFSDFFFIHIHKKLSLDIIREMEEN